jgi:nucleotide-binding universal stress UspA family protein
MYKNILVPVILGDGDTAAKSYAVAQALAGTGAKFTVMHVLEEIPGFVSAEMPGDVVEKAQAAAEQSLKQSAKALPGAAAHLARGHAGTHIVDYASLHDIDCIVVASHKPGVSDFFLGSTASRVVRHAECSVHVIR